MVIRIVALLLGLTAAAGIAREILLVRRVGPPRCRRCGHGVTEAQARGDVAADGRCPECGSGLAEGGIITRLVRPRRIAAWSAVLGLALALPALWPSPAARAGFMPSWWLVDVERRLGGPDVDRLMVDELAERALRGGLSGELVDRLVVEALAALAGTGAWPGAPEEAWSWEHLVLVATADDRLTTGQLAAVHGTLVDLTLTVVPEPPGGVDVRLGLSRARLPGTRVARANPIDPRLRGRLATIVAHTAGMRIDQQSSPSALDDFTVAVDPWIAEPGRGHGYGWSSTPPDQDGFRPTRVPTGPGRHAVAVDLRFSFGSHVWTRTVTTTFVQPQWPPAAWSDPATIAGRILGPPEVRVGEDVVVTARALPPIERLVVQFDFEPVALTGGVRLKPTSASRQDGGSESAPRLELTYAPDGPPPPGPFDLDLRIRRVSIRVPRAELEPPPGPGEPADVVGWIDVPGETVRLRVDVPVTEAEAEAAPDADRDSGD